MKIFSLIFLLGVVFLINEARHHHRHPGHGRHSLPATASSESFEQQSTDEHNDNVNKKHKEGRGLLVDNNSKWDPIKDLTACKEKGRGISMAGRSFVIGFVNKIKNLLMDNIPLLSSINHLKIPNLMIEVPPTSSSPSLLGLLKNITVDGLSIFEISDLHVGIIPMILNMTLNLPSFNISGNWKFEGGDPNHPRASGEGPITIQVKGANATAVVKFEFKRLHLSVTDLIIQLQEGSTSGDFDGINGTVNISILLKEIAPEVSLKIFTSVNPFITEQLSEVLKDGINLILDAPQIFNKFGGFKPYCGAKSLVNLIGGVHEGKVST